MRAATSGGIEVSNRRLQSDRPTLDVGDQSTTNSESYSARRTPALARNHCEGSRKSLLRGERSNLARAPGPEPRQLILTRASSRRTAR